MQGILDWGIGIILWLQHFSPALDLPFKALTSLGEEDFLILFLPLVFWCLDRRTGARLAFIFLVSAFANAAAKVGLQQPRPYEYSPQVHKLFPVSGYGFPSQHTTSTVVVWGFLAARYRRVWLWVLAVALVLLVPLSRLYLGLHFPTDLLGGFVLGVVALALYFWLGPAVEVWLSARHLAVQLALALLLPLILYVLFPITEEQAITSLALLTGMSVGLIFERRWVRFEAGGAWPLRALRLVLGLVVLMALRYGLKAAFAGLAPVPLFHFVRYTIIGLCLVWPLPWAFVRLHLAGRREAATAGG